MHLLKEKQIGSNEIAHFTVKHLAETVLATEDANLHFWSKRWAASPDHTAECWYV